MYAAAVMKLSLDWLSAFVTFKEKDPQKIAEVITAHIAEVDAVEQQGALLEHCCVGNVLSIAKHPNADRLSVCTVQTDKGKKRVVCGGTNLREGMCVAFAHVGATVKWHGEEMATLETVQIRGETSEGMICAAEELEMESLYPPDSSGGEHPIVDLGEKAPVGKSLREYCGFSDTVFYIDNHAITHRADLFSHVGFARELVAIGVAQWKAKPVYKAPAFPQEALPFKIRVEDKSLVSRYCACLLEIDDVGTTPEWMIRRLEATGWRSVSLPVDITNYVTMEIGMPLHSFDADDLKGDIHMRGSKKGERIVTLDAVERALPERSIIISDDEGIFDLLGIMGGLRSSTKEGTRRIFLHSASIDPVSVRQTIIGTGHRTDASTVYEKGIPHVIVQQGFYRAVELFLELVPGARIVSAMDSWGEDGTPRKITCSDEYINGLLGTDIPVKQMVDYLTKLEFSVKEKKGEMTVQTPLHRLGDIRGPHDLAEEIGRLYGFNNIDTVMPHESIDLPARDHRLQQVRRSLKESQYSEFLPLSLLGPELLTRCGMDPTKAVEIENPLGEELSLVQPSLLPRLLEYASEQMRHVDDVLRTFHQGNVFLSHNESFLSLGILCAHRHVSDLKASSFFVLKQDLALAFSVAGFQLSLAQARHTDAAQHPGRSAILSVGDAEVGSLFALHPTIATRFDLPAGTAVTLLNLTALLEQVSAPTIASGISQFPAVVYDETVPFDHQRVLHDAFSQARKASALLEHIEVADLYGKEGESTYKLTFRCTYRAPDRTLTEEEAKKEHGKVVAVFG
ncbi:phenylalanine--tRNA ligase subunit beta [Candidatus Peregrinibacteria bacterium CG10_big_fil_rev_8_21_14_0_10_49_10]|nr:MAG: phenylalanine--tRNA ligase subunit beta [Candidatus Peregrinibacteria bacterium CG10_big_fil_rev_8_21_14_0_10_49_10]